MLLSTTHEISGKENKVNRGIVTASILTEVSAQQLNNYEEILTNDTWSKMIRTLRV